MTMAVALADLEGCNSVEGFPNPHHPFPLAHPCEVLQLHYVCLTAHNPPSSRKFASSVSSLPTPFPIWCLNACFVREKSDDVRSVSANVTHYSNWPQKWGKGLYVENIKTDRERTLRHKQKSPSSDEGR